MKKYSKNQGFIEFSNKFLTNEDCIDECLEYFKKIRWKKGFVCPYCGKKTCWTIAPYKYKCRNCGRQTTVTAGTFFHRTHLTMQQWFKAIYYCCEKGDAANAKDLKSIAGIGSYRIAQSTLENIKDRMYHNDNDKLGWTSNPLDGNVEVGLYPTSINNTNTFLIIAAEYNGNRIIRIRIFENKNLRTTKNVEEFLKPKYITRDSKITYDYNFTDLIFEYFSEWCKWKKTKNFTVLSRSYCRKYDRCNIPVSFDTVLENMVKL